MTILITGANGQLGNALREASLEGGHRYIFTDVAEVDITSAAAIDEIFSRDGVEVVINCAAYTAVDKEIGRASCRERVCLSV